jgi:hypothetical protein
MPLQSCSRIQVPSSAIKQRAHSAPRITAPPITLHAARCSRKNANTSYRELAGIGAAKLGRCLIVVLFWKGSGSLVEY